MNVDQDLMCKFITFKGDAKKALAKAKKKNSAYYWVILPLKTDKFEFNKIEGPYYQAFKS